MAWETEILTLLNTWLLPNFTTLRMLGMAFVLGNFFTATADDLDHMSSTRGFLKTWTIIVVFVLILEILDIIWRSKDSGYDIYADVIPFIVKWVLLMVLCALCHMRIGAIFKLATGDVVAIASAGALLSPLLILIFFIILKIVDILEKPLLRKFGDGEAYPFMPVVFTSFGLILALGLGLKYLILGYI